MRLCADCSNGSRPSPSALRAFLVELGARALLDGGVIFTYYCTRPIEISWSAPIAFASRSAAMGSSAAGADDEGGRR